MPGSKSKKSVKPIVSTQESYFNLEDMPSAQEPVKDPRRASTSKGRKTSKEPYTAWKTPFLEPDGRVWCYIGYGDWELRQPDNERVIFMLDHYQRFPAIRIGAEQRLTFYKARIEEL